MLGSQYAAADANALRPEDDAINPAALIHGRMAPNMGQPILSAGQPMASTLASPAPPPMTTRPPMPTGAPLMPQGGATDLPSARPRPTQAPAPAQAPMSFEDQTQAYRKAMRQAYPDMSPKDFEANIQYGIAKQRGRMGAQRWHRISKPMALYMSAMAKQHDAELSYKQLNETLASKRAEFTIQNGPAAGTMDQEQWAPYQNRLNASRMKVEDHSAQTDQYQAALNKLGVTNKDLANPVTINEYLRSLVAADPAQAQDHPDDTDMQIDDNAQ